MPHRLLPLAGSQVGNYGYRDHAVGLDALFNNPSDCEQSKDRNYLYVADAGNHLIRRVTLSGSYPVETFCPAENVSHIYVNQTTGNLWFFTHDYTIENYDEQLHHINKATPSGNVTIARTLIGQSPVDLLPDHNERFVRVKIGVEGYGAKPFLWHWYMFDILAGSDPRFLHADDWLAGSTSQMWSDRHPDTAIYTTHFRDNWRSGVGMHRAEEHGAPFDYRVEHHFEMRKIVNGIPEGPNETLIAVWGNMKKVLYNADPSAPYISDPADAGLGLPQMPATTLARDPIADTYYFPMNGGANQAGLSSNIPLNTVGVGVPTNQLSIISPREPIDG